MKTLTKRLVFSASLLSALTASAASITGVSANQRWPWNNLVDVDFTISDSSASMAYRIELSATYNGGENKVYANSYLTEPVVEGDGPKRVTWDLGADCPGLKIDDFTITVAATPLVGNDIPVYMVIDLSSGKDSVKYPVRYTTKAPDLGNDKCRTMELWLRRIKAGSEFYMGGNDSGMTTYLPEAKKMRLTKDFYMAIFETTQQQWAQVMGTWPSYYSNLTWRATRPMESVSRNDVRGSLYYYPWPNDNNQGTAGSVGVSTFAGKIRARTGLNKFDLPTEAQWVYAALGGSAETTGSDSKRGIYPAVGPIGDNEVRKVARCGGTNGNGNGGGVADGDVGISEDPNDTTGTMTVGHYHPNAYGLYDMLGNVWEMVLDRWAAGWPAEVDPVDYKGPATGEHSVLKGLPYSWSTYYYSVRARKEFETIDQAKNPGMVGARFCVTLD